MWISHIFVIVILMAILNFISASAVDYPTEDIPFSASGFFANSETPYTFKVPRNGNVMRLEIKGTMPMNTWKSVDMEVYDSNDNYLFSVQDELWSESGKDSSGEWTEHSKSGQVTIRFKHKGDYYLYLSDSAEINKSTANVEFIFRVVPVRGLPAIFYKWVTIYVFAAVALYPFMIIYSFVFDNKDKSSGSNSSPPESKQWHKILTKAIWSITLSIWCACLFWPLTDFEADFNYINIAKHNKYVEVLKLFCKLHLLELE